LCGCGIRVKGNIGMVNVGRGELCDGFEDERSKAPTTRVLIENERSRKLRDAAAFLPGAPLARLAEAGQSFRGPPEA
jgi:hypothetical protein